jgi:hypothetical protein
MQSIWVEMKGRWSKSKKADDVFQEGWNLVKSLLKPNPLWMKETSWLGALQT